MKKELAIVLLLFAALSVSGAKIMPDPIESLQPGDSITTGTYHVTKGLAEESFHPWTYGSELTFGGDYDTGGMIAQQAQSLGGTGTQLGTVDRQYTDQSADAFIIKSDAGLPWDPENPATELVSQIGLTKDNSMRFSGAIVQTDPTIVTGTDINGDKITDDPWSGDHLLQWVADGENPSLSVALSDNALIWAGTEDDSRVLTEDLNGYVTIAADAVDVYPNDVFQITDVPGGNDGLVCVGANQIWEGIRYPGTNVYPNVDPDQHMLAASGDLLDYVTVRDQSAQLTELMGYAHSEALVTTTSTQTSSDVDLKTIMAGDGHLGGAFENAVVDPGVEVSVMPSGKFDFDWELAGNILER
jgi:hypothetical protein